MIGGTLAHSRKFLFYTHSLAGGGAERVWALLASECARLGHDVSFVVDFDSPENQAFIDPAVKVVQLPHLSGHLGHVIATFALARMLRREKPDVSFSAIGVSNLKLMIASLLAWRWRRAVISYHGFFPSEPQFLSRMGNRLTPILTRLCGRAIAVSDGLKTALLENHGASRARTVRIYNPVDFLGAPTALSSDELAARAPQIVSVGRFVEDKDLLTLLRAFAQVKTPGAQLLMVGDGPMRHEIEHEIQVLGLENRVTLAGYLRDPSSAYRSSRVLVLSSLRESFGNVVAEALAHGLAVVSTDAVGPVEILDHGRYGCIVPVGDIEALARAMEDALDHPGDPAPRMARAALFHVNIATKAYLALAEDVLNAD